LGHAVAARYHGVRVGKIGIMFFLCAPLAYVDVTDAWKLRNRWSRVQIALAGVYLELAVASIAAWAWWWLPDGYVRHLAAQMFLVAGPATLLVNANPLLRLDGYYVVSDLTEIPNLRMHGRSQLAGICNHLLLGTVPKESLLGGWRQPFATVHAFASVVFQIVWMSGLVIGVSLWARGLGVLLATAAILLWAVLPLTRWTISMWLSKPAEKWYLNDTRIRLLCYASLLLMLGQNLSMSDSPLARRVPVVVQFHDEQIARASVDSFVTRVYVTRGQRVGKGMLLMELHDPELLLTREKKLDDLELAQLRAIQFRRQQQFSKAAAEAENAESLRRQLTELDAQVAGLRVTAERDGLIISPAIENMAGRFVKQGDELLRVSDPQEKELLVTVAEDDMQAYQLAAQQSKLASVRLRGGTKLIAKPVSLRPRARRRLPHPALAATVGGPLAVEPSSAQDQPMRLVEPHLESRTILDPATSASVRDGQIGMMTIADNRSLLTRVFDAMLPY
jgi:putative peptide zinc metalloprotease protein